MNNTLYEMTKMYGAGKGESMMWNTVRVISDAVEESMPEEARDHLKREMYEMMVGKHFDEYFAKEAVAKMYYVDSAGVKRAAPYWTEDSIRGIYDQVRQDIRPYNYWDFYVTLNMIASDNYGLIERWFPGEEGSDKDRRFVTMAVNWLNDPDSQHKDCKIWCYLNE